MLNFQKEICTLGPITREWTENTEDTSEHSKPSVLRYATLRNGSFWHTPVHILSKKLRTDENCVEFCSIFSLISSAFCCYIVVFCYICMCDIFCCALYDFFFMNRSLATMIVHIYIYIHNHSWQELVQNINENNINDTILMRLREVFHWGVSRGQKWVTSTMRIPKSYYNEIDKLALTA